MKTEGRLAAIDVGRRRVGIARTDLLQLSPNTVGTFEPDEAIDELVRQVEEEGVTGIVTGWPLTPDGREGEATQMVESFVRRLKKKLPDCPIRYVDERYTSREAVDQLVRSGVPKKKRRQKGRIDRAAAAIILQQFLDSDQEI